MGLRVLSFYQREKRDGFLGCRGAFKKPQQGRNSLGLAGQGLAKRTLHLPHQLGDLFDCGGLCQLDGIVAPIVKPLVG